MAPRSLPARNFILPALLPPPGVTPNFVNPESCGSRLVIASSICLAFMGLFVLMRFYTRIHIKHKLGWDDYTCVPAAIGAVGFAAVSISMLSEGIGIHQWNVPITDFSPDLLRKFIVVDIVYSPSILMAKLSLLFLYLEIFRPNIKLRYFIYFGMVFVTLFYTATMIGFFYYTMPRPGQSLLTAIAGGNTEKDIGLSIVQASVNVASDFYILSLPIVGVWKLQLSPKKRVGVTAIFMTGLLACLASVIGLYYRVQLNNESDVTWNLVVVLLWVTVELTIGVMCGCMPASTAFAKYHLPFFRSLASRLSYRQKSYHSASTSASSRSKRLATNDIKVTLGSRIDGQGQFMNPDTIFGTTDTALGKEEEWIAIQDTQNGRGSREGLVDKIVGPAKESMRRNGGGRESLGMTRGWGAGALGQYGTRRAQLESRMEMRQQWPLRPQLAARSSTLTHIRSSYGRDRTRDVEAGLGLPDKGIWVETEVNSATDG